jgi:hypothetical protein
VGHHLPFDREALRIAVAAALGASVTPVLFVLTRRLPVIGRRRWRNALVHVVAAIVLSFALNVISCVLAAWLLAGRMLPSMTEVGRQLAGNWLLLIYALLALTAIVHAVHFLAAPARQADEETKHTARIQVKTRGRLHFIDLQNVDWIETQGNYLALHAGAAVHLIRQTSAKFEAGLDPERFVRIHRRLIVALDRIRGIGPLANGDALITLTDGRELRMSRRYREAVRAKWHKHFSGGHRRCDSKPWRVG